MYLSDLGGALRRRWYVGVVGVFLIVGLALTAMKIVPAKYQTTATVVLLPPKLAIGAGANPFLALGGLQSTADVFARVMSDDETSRAIQASGGSKDFTVEADPTTPGPVLLVTVNGATATEADHTLSQILDRLPLALDRLQADASVGESFRMTASTVARQDPPTAVRKDQLRAVIVAAVLGVAITLLAAALLDGLISRRRGGGATLTVVGDGALEVAAAGDER